MYPYPYIKFLAHFHGTRDYFECHEVLEDHWKEVAPGQRNSVWVLLIQLAVTLYHHRRGNWKGAGILINKTIEKLPANREHLSSLGINVNDFQELLLLEKDTIEKRNTYQSLSIPIYDPALKEEVVSLCNKWEVSYGLPSDLNDERLIHRHQRKFRT
ncbi:DUF309 domain-containing protein [Halobacillus andaensis]|uniref:DUF309 domain-containing protein n=1 Tax=Halobacillus andaensis TaxID=1176239 RepID=UPI003D7170EF